MKQYLMYANPIRPPRLGSMWILLVVLLLPCLSHAQGFDYGNAWYDPSVDYVRLQVARDGIYRVTPQQLMQAGYDTAGIDPAHWHLVYRGAETHVHVEPAPTGGWQYIEFFGRRNDGGLDSLMYMDSYFPSYSGAWTPNPDRSAFSDTSIYYLYADNQSGLRLQPPSLVSVPPVLTQTSYLRTVAHDFDLSAAGYLCGCLGSVNFPALNPNWTPGEGYGMLPIDSISGLRLAIPTPHGTGAVPGNLHLRLIGVLPNTAVTLQIQVNGQLVSSIVRSTMFTEDMVIPIPPVTLDSTVVVITHSTTLGHEVPPFRISRAAVTYQAATVLDGSAHTTVVRTNVTDEYYRFEQLAPAALGIGYDLVHHERVVDTMRQDTLGIWVAGHGLPSLFYVASEAGIMTPTIAPAPPAHDLGATANAADLVLITSRALASSATAYRNYRQASTVNPMVVRIVYTDEIYEEFGHGVTHPMAIKRFCKYALDEWAISPSHFFIWGDGSADVRAGGVNHVPVYGEPASDVLYVAGFRRDTVDFRQRAAIGRLPIATDIEGQQYLGKLLTYETAPEQGWMRRGIFTAEAMDTMSLQALGNMMQVAADTFAGAPLYGRAFRKDFLGATQVNGGPETLTQLYEEGVAIAKMMGITASQAQLPWVDSVSNADRFPFLVGESCNFAPIDADTASVAEDWVMASGRGAIAALGYSGYAYASASYVWSRGFDHFAYHGAGQASLGEAMRSATDSLLVNLGQSNTYFQTLAMVYVGDPAIRLRTGSFAVWPGDANDDLVAEPQDLLAIGLAYGQQGPARPNATTNWVRQLATPWDTTVVGGADMAHADCNGDGTVNSDDTLAIVQNYGLVHNKSVGLTTGAADDPELMIETSTEVLPTGAQVDLFVRLGTALHPADSVYGIAWSLYYDPLLVDSASVVVSFDSCWLGTLGTNILTLSRQVHSQGRIDLAITRTDHTPISGEGIISRVGIVVIDNISGKLPGDSVALPLPLTPAQVTMIDPRGALLPVQGIERTITVMGTVPLPDNLAGREFAIFPNPTTDAIYVYTAQSEACTVRVMDLQGRVVMEKAFPEVQHKRMDLGALAPGTYLLRLEAPSGNHHAQVVRMR